MTTVNPSVATPVVSTGGNFQVNEKTADGKFVTLSFASLLIWAGLKSLEGSRAAFKSQFDIAQSKVNVMQELNALMQMATNLKGTFDSKSTADDKKVMDEAFSKALKAFMDKHPGMVAQPKLSEFWLSSLTKDQINKLLDDKDNKKKIEDGTLNGFKYKVSDLKKEIGAELEGKLRINGGYLATVLGCLGHPPTLRNEIRKDDLSSFVSNLQTAQSTLSSENEQQSMRTNQAMNRSSGFLQQLQGMMQTAKEALQAASKAGSA